MGHNRRQVSPFSSLNTILVNLIRVPIADADYCATALDCFPGSATLAVGDELTLDEKRVLPDSGRNLTATLTSAGASSIKVKFRGTDQFGKRIEEELGPLTNAGGLVAGAKIFQTVDAIVEVTEVANTTEASDTLNVGFGSKLGLPVPIAAITDVKAITRDGVGGIDIDADTVDVTNNALKGDSANGIGSNSGVIAANDSFNVMIRLTPATVVDDVIT